jgi:hypothetical protein
MLNVPIDEVLIRIKLDVANWARETHRITTNATKRRLGRRVRWLFGAGCEIFNGDISCDIQTKKQTGQIVN